jgi:hypothetical protein
MDRFTRAGRRKQDESFGLPAGQVAGFSVLFAALLAAFFLFPGQIELVFGVFVAALGAGKVVAGHLAARDNDELPPASRAFRELADPARPLADDAAVTGGDGRTDRTVASQRAGEEAAP